MLLKKIDVTKISNQLRYEPVYDMLKNVEVDIYFWNKNHSYDIDFITKMIEVGIEDMYDDHSKLTDIQKETIRLIFKGDEYFISYNKDNINENDIMKEIILDNKWAIDHNINNVLI